MRHQQTLPRQRVEYSVSHAILHKPYNFLRRNAGKNTGRRETVDMNTAAPFEYHLLGSPALTQAGDNATDLKRPRFRYRPAWRLVAYLHLCGGSQTNQRVCDDLDLNDSILSQIVSDCNRVLGRGAVKREARCFVLNTRLLSTDVAQFDALVRQAHSEKDSDARARLLRSAMDLVRGDFLAGLSDFTDDWVDKRQQEWHAKIKRECKTLLELYKELEQPREAYETICHLATVMPHDEGIHTLLLRDEHELGDLQTPSDKSLAEWIAFARQLSKRGLTVTLRETRQFEKFFAAKWKRLKPYHSTLQRLCILEGSFDTEFAEAICEVTSAELSALANLALLIEHDGRFEMPPPMRQWISDTLPAAQKVEMQAAYHEWIRFTFVCEISAYQPPPPELFNRWQRNAHHLEIVLNALLDSPIPEPAAMNQIWFDFCPPCTRYFFPDRMQDAYHFLAGLLDETPNAYRIAASANVGWLMFLMRQYEAAAQHYHEIRDSWREKAEQKILCDHNFLHYTNSLHHGGKVEKAAELLEAYLPLIDPEGSPHFLQDTLNSYAVSLLALGRFEAAYAVSGRDIALRRQYPGRSLASPLYHQGMALAGLKRYTEALASFDEALELFKQDYVPHGEADCLQQMGKIHAERGQVNTGKRLIEDALRIYEQIPQMQSRAACLRSLGDVLKIKGDLEGAKAAYCEGLAFWENEVAEGCGGSGWVQRFRERLGQ